MGDFYEALKSIMYNLAIEHPTFYSTILTGLLAAIFTTRTIAKQRELSREKNSLDFQATYKHNQEVSDSWHKIREVRGNLEELKRLGKDECSGEETAKALNVICNEWERCANAIKKNVYDEDFLYNCHGSTVYFIYRDFHPYINERRKKNPKFFNNFVWLAERWCKKRANELKKTDHEEFEQIEKEHLSIKLHLDKIARKMNQGS
ncbi:DUF4760 domain-containing protein [Salinicola socius]|uniref:DUF4760 domain-containing protein n=1 Tax=Salinicola socius TaxID=404433 RepID=A0A1Q8SUP0_9GAMM|nr:DUF4760 domain-containing protein [Salinicola socius]OLO05123.1 hypothetical protein BTW07_05785 [Salinicola socius]